MASGMFSELPAAAGSAQHDAVGRLDRQRSPSPPAPPASPKLMLERSHALGGSASAPSRAFSAAAMAPCFVRRILLRGLRIIRNEDLRRGETHIRGGVSGSRASVCWKAETAAIPVGIRAAVELPRDLIMVVGLENGLREPLRAARPAAASA